MKKLITIIYLLFLNNFLSAEIIKKIEISGNERVSEETVKVYGDISINQNVDNLKINEIIKNLYSTNFFEDINVTVSNNTLFNHSGVIKESQSSIHMSNLSFNIE